MNGNKKFFEMHKIQYDSASNNHDGANNKPEYYPYIPNANFSQPELPQYDSFFYESPHPMSQMNQNLVTNQSYWQNTFPFESHIRSNTELSVDTASVFYDPNASPGHVGNDVYRFPTNVSMSNPPSTPLYESYFSYDYLPAHYSNFTKQTLVSPADGSFANFHMPNPTSTNNQMGVFGSIPIPPQVNDAFTKKQLPSVKRVPAPPQRVIQQMSKNSAQNHLSNSFTNGITNKIPVRNPTRKSLGVQKSTFGNSPNELDKKLKHNHMEKLRRHYVSNSFKMLESMVGLETGKRVSKAEILRATRRRIGDLNLKCIQTDKDHEKSFKRLLDLSNAIRSMISN